MNCEICLLDSSADAVMWSCIGCERTFHAACVGVTVHRSSLRKKDRKTDPNSYLLPCCSSCQTLVTLNFDIKSLTEQQAKLAEAINLSTEVVHRANQRSNFHAIEELVERCDGLLQQHATPKRADKAFDEVSIRNHLTSLLNIAMETSKDNMAAYMEALTQDITRELRGIHTDFEKVSSLTIDMANHCSEHMSQPTLAAEIVKEIKTLSNGVNLLDINLPDVQASSSPLSSNKLCSNKSSQTVSGWRFLGSKKVWRSDWTEYDAKKLRREQQQKASDKATKRRRDVSKKKRATTKKDSRNQNKNKNMRIDRNDRNISSRHPDQANNKHVNIRSSFHYSKMPINHNQSHQPPPQCVHFSRPPTRYRPTIQFHRGEMLNPCVAYPAYPASDVHMPPAAVASTSAAAVRSAPVASCDSCSRHWCFLKN